MLFWPLIHSRDVYWVPTLCQALFKTLGLQTICFLFEKISMKKIKQADVLGSELGVRLRGVLWIEESEKISLERWCLSWDPNDEKDPLLGNGEGCSRHREQQVQRPWGGNRRPMFTEQKESPGAWTATKAGGEVDRGQTEAGLVALKGVWIVLRMWREAPGGC